MTTHEHRQPRVDAQGVARASILGLLVVFAVASHHPAVSAWLGGATGASARLSSWGRGGPAVFVFVATLGIALGVPRLLTCFVAGIAFGFGWGLVWAETSAVLGSLATFALVRHTSRDSVLAKWPVLERFERPLRRHGVLAVVLVKQLPISAVVGNGFLALSSLTYVELALGSLLGTLPQAIPATLAGASGAVRPPETHVLIAAAALVLAVALSWLARTIARRPLPDAS